MEVVGQLVKLGDSDLLPIPWQCRGHLGLQTGTPATLGFTKPEKNLLPDIIIAPYDLRDLKRILFIEIEGKDKTGFINEVQRCFETYNIGVSDSVTTLGRDKHRINLSIQIMDPRKSAQKIEQTLIENLGEKFGKENVKQILKPAELKDPFPFVYDSPVYNGEFLQHAWRSTIIESAAESDIDIENYDLTRLVVSSNTTARFVRYIIPKKGTHQVSVGHSDRPAAAKSITEQIAALNLNILIHRITPTPMDKKSYSSKVSTFVAVCEPSKPTKGNDAFIQLEKKLNEAGTQSRIGTTNVSFHDGVDSRKTLFLVPNKHTLLGPPRGLWNKMVQYSEEADSQTITSPQNRRKPKVFISHRFHGHADKKNILDALKKALNNNGCQWLEAPVNHKEERTLEPIHARLWLADAMVIIAFDKDDKGELSISQGHEIGFARGQRKKFKIITNEKYIDTAKDLFNEPDLTYILYKDAGSFIRSGDRGSLHKQVSEWIQQTNHLERDGID